MKEQTPESPVPIQVHYDILRYVERTVMTELGKVKHPWMPTGTRVAYSLAGTDGMPTGREYRLECGYPDPLDQATTIWVNEEEWRRLLEQEGDTHVLPIAFVDELHKSVQEKLEDSADQPLVVGIAGVLTGSTWLWGSGCWCPGRKAYYIGSRKVCTTFRC